MRGVLATLYAADLKVVIESLPCHMQQTVNVYIIYSQFGCIIEYLMEPVKWWDQTR